MEQEKAYLQIVQYLPDIVYEINLGGFFRFVSKAISRWGFNPDELVGRHFSSIIHPEDLPNVCRDDVLRDLQSRESFPDVQPGLFDERRTGKRITRNLRVRLKPAGDRAAEGMEPVFEVISLGLYDHNTLGDGELVGTLGVMRDVNDLCNKEKALVHTEKHYRLLIENSSEVITILAHDGTVLYKSDSVRRVLGFDPLDLIGTNEYDGIMKEDRQVLEKAVKCGLAPDDDIVVYRTRNREGSWRFLESSVRRIRDDEGTVICSVINSRDMTERRRMQKALGNSERKYRSIYEKALVGMITADTGTGMVLTANTLGFSMFGYMERRDMIGEPISSLFLDGKMFTDFIGDLQARGSVDNLETEFRKSDGTVFWGSLTAKNDDFQGTMEVVVSDITRHKENEERLFRFTYYDQLTDLPNRALFTMFMEREITKDRPFAVIGIGLDRFKHINEVYGTAAGNQLLRAIAHKLSTTYFQKDVVSRFEGDHYMILIADMGPEGLDINIENVHTIASKTVDLFAEPFRIDGMSIGVTPSIGMSLYPADGRDVETIINNCETSLYIAKEKGGNTFHYYDAGLNERMTARLQLEKDMRLALENREFVTYYQPRVDRNGTFTGLEALVRWKSASRGRLIMPDEFIPLAEKSGMIMDIGMQVLEAAAACARKWGGCLDPMFRVAVNISPEQFSRPDLVKSIREILDATGIDPCLMELEITESAIMSDEAKGIRTLNDLHDAGIALAIDDFGTGYSSLSKLRLYPIDLLKIDKSFIMDLPGDRQSAVIARTIIDMAHNLGFGVVAEGVETKEQLDFLVEHGCEHFQGYYFHRPLPEETISEILKGG